MATWYASTYYDGDDYASILVKTPRAGPSTSWAIPPRPEQRRQGRQGRHQRTHQQQRARPLRQRARQRVP